MTTAGRGGGCRLLKCRTIGMDHDKGCTPPGTAARARPSWRRPAMALMLLLGATASAHAQFGGGHGHRQRDQQQTPQKSKAPTPLPALPEIWPRLEGGALICKSRDDLVRYQAQIANAADRRPTATPSRSRRAFRFWITTVHRAPKLSRRTSPKRPGGPIATCLRPRHLLSPKAPVQGSDVTGLSRSTRSFSPR
jgi:hypothetical protein